MADLYPSWLGVWAGLKAGGDARKPFDYLRQRYSEPWRKYHTLQHVSERIARFDKVRHLAQVPAEVEAALWFHDAVYELRAHDNEDQSADLARSIFAAAGVDTAAIARIVGMILATKHTAQPADDDARLLVDIDLSILGAPAPRFAEYERQIREEYAFVPEALFVEKRRENLRSFVARPSIFSTSHFVGLLEQTARGNLARAINA